MDFRHILYSFMLCYAYFVIFYHRLIFYYIMLSHVYLLFHVYLFCIYSCHVDILVTSIDNDIDIGGKDTWHLPYIIFYFCCVL